MIYDKDYIIRIVKQFSEMLATLLLGKNEGTLPEEQQNVFETNMNDTFNLASQSTDSIIAMIDAKDKAHHIPYYELLGHIFYFKNKENANPDFAQKAKTFYEIYLQRSGIFSLPIVNRIGELKS